MSILTLGGRAAMPTAPPDIAEEVEMFARQHGRTAKLHFVPFGGWFAEFEVRANDPLMKGWREGRLDKPPSERVWFHLPNPRAHQRGQSEYMQLDIIQLGRQGVRRFLDQGNTWSGRGEFKSIEHAAKVILDRNDEMKVKNKKAALEHAVDVAKDRRRTRFGIPFIRVLKDIGKRAK
jgi:hypothetical protein